jgi:D-alanine-D-alanine ligase-like ATP-grasp enzyme
MLATRLIARLGMVPWRPARELGAALDIVRETGPRYPVQRWRERRALAAREASARDLRYRQIWGDAAAELGAEMIDLSGGYLELRRDGAVTRVWRHWVMLDDAVTLRLALDKTRVHRLLAERGLPVPVHEELCYREVDKAFAVFKRSGGCAVVKPASGSSSGSAVTSGVSSRDDLLRAWLRAARLGDRILIERQATGDMFRLLFLDGDLLGTVRRRPPRVTGDGRSSVAKLIAAENRRRLARIGGTIITVDLDALLTLRKQGLSLASVPPPGAMVAVKGVSSQNAFEENETVRDPPSRETIGAAREAVQAVGLRLGGVDLITPDAGMPLAEAGGVIIEVNGTPGIHYHYEVSEPARAQRVAIPILARLLELQGAGDETRKAQAKE